MEILETKEAYFAPAKKVSGFKKAYISVLIVALIDLAISLVLVTIVYKFKLDLLKDRSPIDMSLKGALSLIFYATMLIVAYVLFPLCLTVGEDDDEDEIPWYVIGLFIFWFVSIYFVSSPHSFLLALAYALEFLLYGVYYIMAGGIHGKKLRAAALATAARVLAVTFVLIAWYCIH